MVTSVEDKIKAKAQEIGFSACGITDTQKLSEAATHLQEWLDNKYHASMKWMENHFEKRVEPVKLQEGAQSVIVVLLNYFPEQSQNKDAPQIAKYAYGKDYHFILKDRLHELLAYIKELVPETSGRAFVDSAPLLERSLAQKAGLGWIGKNSLLIQKDAGSFFLIGELLITTKLAPDTPHTKDFCGTCTRCIDACPSGAIVSPRVIDSNKCLSYWTIEHKGEFPQSVPDLQDRAFGCDICQDVCPWNKKAIPHSVPEFTPHASLLTNTVEDWEDLTANEYSTIFAKSAVKRTKYSGLMRNISKIKREKSSQQIW